MWIQRVCESIPITWIKTDPHTPELQPWALAFYPFLSNFPGGFRKEMTPPRAWRRAVSRGLADSIEQWMWSPVNHRTLTHTSWTKFDFHILYSKKLKIAHVKHRKNIKYCDIKAPECGKEINPEHVASSIRTLTSSTLWKWWGPTGRICSGLRTCWVSKFCDDFVIFF